MALTGQEKTRPFGQSNYGVYCCAVGSFLRAQTAQAFEKTGENKEKMPEGRGKAACGGKRYAHARVFIHAARLLIWSVSSMSQF